MTEPTDKNPVCPECKKRAPSVSRVTLYHLLEPAASRTIDNEKRFRICRTRSCSVLYFSSDHDQSWDVSDARTTIGFKQPPDKPPHTVCYCFGYTAENIENEIRETGESTVVEWISERVQADKCACEYKNPTGRCCLGDVREAVEKGKQSFRKD